MRTFRLYFIDGRQKIIEATAIECADDQQAIEEARRWLGEREAVRGVEVWDRARRVVQLMRE